MAHTAIFPHPWKQSLRLGLDGQGLLRRCTQGVREGGKRRQGKELRRRRPDLSLTLWEPWNKNYNTVSLSRGERLAPWCSFLSMLGSKGWVGTACLCGKSSSLWAEGTSLEEGQL